MNTWVMRLPPWDAGAFAAAGRAAAARARVRMKNL
jgi:hypothetical protein